MLGTYAFDDTNDRKPTVLFVQHICGEVERDETAWKDKTVSNTDHTSHVLYGSTREWMFSDERLSALVCVAKLVPDVHMDPFEDGKNYLYYRKFLVL